MQPVQPHAICKILLYFISPKNDQAISSFGVITLKYIDKMSYPEPLLPTIATFCPGFTLKLRLFNISRPGVYEKLTDSNETDAVLAATCNCVASFSF